MRLAAYGAISTTLATAVVLAAFQQRPNFYSACVYLSQSNACLMILTNMGFFLTILFGFAVQKIFFGHLRAIEEAHLRERIWFAVTETFLAMTVFRDEFNTRFVVMFVSLLFVKCFHWICQDRIDYMEQFPTIPWHFHLRMVSAMLVFLAADVAFISHSIDATIRYGASMMIMFGFEFILLAATVTAIFAKYVLNVIDSRHTEAWENRSIYMFYLELATDFFKLITYLAFFSIILTYYGLPLHIIRDVYLTLRSFAKKLMSFIRYRQATAHMNERYPDATAEELEATGDRTCIICREQMVHGGEAGRERMRPKKLRCGHILHFHCLRSWLERQQSCPTCRRPVLEETRTPPPTRGLVPPVPPMPVPAPVAIPIQQAPAAAETPPAVPGPTPAPSARNLPRLVAGGPITLPPGYILPPGWAVIPAQNVQIVPTVGPNTTGVQNIQVATPLVTTQNITGAPGPSPGPAGTAEGNGDATGANPITQPDHVAPTNPTTTSSDGSQNTNISHPSTPVSPNITNLQSNPSAMNTNGPNPMQRPNPPRLWAAHPAHNPFPALIPLFGNVDNIGAQHRSTPVIPPTAVAQRAATQSSSVTTNGATSDRRREADEQSALLQQMGASVRVMQDLVSKMSTLLPPQTLPFASSVESAQLPPLEPSQPSTSRTVSTILNGHSPPSGHPSPILLKKRRSASPLERTDENEHPHPSRVRRLSSSEDEMSPEELADIRAPWVEPTTDDGLPLDDVQKQGSPPRLRSPSRSPSGSLLRRGSLLKHDITNEISDTEGDPQTVRLDKGKGKEVFVEDGSEGE